MCITPNIKRPISFVRKAFITKLIGLFSLSLISFSGFSQNTSIGIKIGSSTATITSDQSSYDLLGFRAGGFLTYSISKDFGIGTEVNFMRRSGNMANSGAVVLMDHVEIPVLGYFFLGSFNSDRFRPKLIAGTYYNKLLQAKSGEKQMQGLQTETYGLQAGIGFHHRLNNRKWFYGDIRYSYGLEKLLGESEQSGRDIAINLGISFPLDMTH